MARAWVRWTEYVDQRARSKEVCSKVLRRMQNMKVAGVFDAWSATRCARESGRRRVVEPRRAAAAVPEGCCWRLKGGCRRVLSCGRNRAAAESTRLAAARSSKGSGPSAVRSATVLPFVAAARNGTGVGPMDGVC